MKKGIIAVAVVIVLLVGATWLLGGLTESGVKNYFEELDQENPIPQLSLELPDYERGFFKSTATTSIGVEGVDEDGFLKHEVFHGPVAMTSDGIKPGMAYIVTTLDRAKLPAETLAGLTEIYGEEEPFTVKTTVSLTGGRTSVLEVAAVDINDDDSMIRFDGASGFLQASAGSAEMEAALDISPLSVKVDKEGEESRLRFGGFSLELAGDQLSGVSGSGKMEALSLKTSGEEAMSAEVEGITLEMNYRLAEEGSSIYLGEGSTVIPAMAMKFDGKGGIEIGDIEVKNDSVLEGGMIRNTQTTLFGSIDQSFQTDGEMAALSEMLKQGASLSATTTLPQEVAEMMSDLQGVSPDPETGELSPEGKKKLADALEVSLKGISKGTGVTLDLAVGDNSKPMKAGLELTYMGEGMLTDTGSIQEIIDLVDLELNAELPGEMLELLPEETAENIGMLTATGALVETSTGVKSSITLKEGALLSNGKPNMLFETMKPMLAMPMDWDGVFDGIRQASEE